jgi:hypothetical protein
MSISPWKPCAAAPGVNQSKPAQALVQAIVDDVNQFSGAAPRGAMM